MTSKLVGVEEMDPGKFYYLCLGNQLQNCVMPNIAEQLDLIVGIDGLPLMKFTGTQLWLILAYCNFNVDHIIMVGLYCGKSKPSILYT